MLAGAPAVAVTATIATVVCILLGVPLAWLLARVEFPGRRLVRALVTVPLVLPPVVGGVALLLAFGRDGSSGVARLVVRDHAPVHHAGVVLAEAFVAMPFLVITVEGALRGADTGSRRPPPRWAPAGGPRSAGSRCR